MKYYVYLLKFDDDLHFKIGITKDPISRISKHHFSFGILKDGVRLFETTKYNAISIERVLLGACPNKADAFNGIDGNTEVRLMSDYDTCINIVSQLHDKLGIHEVVFDFRHVNVSHRYDIKIDARNIDNSDLLTSVLSGLRVLTTSKCSIYAKNHSTYIISSNVDLDIQHYNGAYESLYGDYLSLGITSKLSYDAAIQYTYTLTIHPSISDLINDNEMELWEQIMDIINDVP